MVRAISVLSFQLFCAAASGGTPSGFFYALEATNGSDRLHRIDWNGTVTSIGVPGQLAWPNVEGLCWDRVSQTLYSFETQFHQLMRINTLTGVASFVANTASVFPQDTAFNVNDGRLYVSIQGNNLNSFDVLNGAIQNEHLTTPVIAHILDTIGGVDGLAYFYNGLNIRRDDGGPTIFLGGSLTYGDWVFWDEATDTLFSATKQINQQGLVNKLAINEVNQVTGNSTLLATITLNPPIPTLGSLEYVPTDDLQPVCEDFDADGDNDFDLEDFAIMQNCFDGPAE